MKTKTAFILTLLVVTGIVVRIAISKSQRTESKVAIAVARDPIRDSSTAPTAPVVVPEPRSPAESGTNPAGQPFSPAPQIAQPSTTLQTTPAQPPQRELQDPLARIATALVGADPQAESYWINAIFDASLSDQEREDLMEDLNEEGLSDPKHPGSQDLPLIINRLALIEEIAPYADEFMLSHLGEAYKDLWNLAALTQGGGQPVQ